MEKPDTGETIRIPTAVDQDKYYISTGSNIRSPSIVLIENSPSPKRNKLNRYQEVPKIPTRSRIPVLQRSVGSRFSPKIHKPSQSPRASIQQSSSNSYPTQSTAFSNQGAGYEKARGQASTSKNLPVLPAIGVASGNGSHQEQPNSSFNAGYTVQGTAPVAGQYYHATNAKPVFQMKAEYNSMLQKYASNMQHKHAASTPHHNHSPRAPCKGCGRHVTQPVPNPAMGHSYVQQWLVNPSHPYQFPPQGSHSPARLQPNVEPSGTHAANELSDLKHSVAAAPLVLSSPTNNARKLVTNKQAEVPIRYTQVPTQQVVSKTSGKLLTPEDALKRELKKKKIPPLTKRNSLRSIFSDGSSNLQKIAEEGDEDRRSDSKSGSLSKELFTVPSPSDQQVRYKFEVFFVSIDSFRKKTNFEVEVCFVKFGKLLHHPYRIQQFSPSVNTFVGCYGNLLQGTDQVHPNCFSISSGNHIFIPGAISC